MRHLHVLVGEFPILIGITVWKGKSSKVGVWSEVCGVGVECNRRASRTYPVLNG